MVAARNLFADPTLPYGFRAATIGSGPNISLHSCFLTQSTLKVRCSLAKKEAGPQRTCFL
jgi:hypothetical protein